MAKLVSTKALATAALATGLGGVAAMAAAEPAYGAGYRWCEGVYLHGINSDGPWTCTNPNKNNFNWVDGIAAIPTSTEGVCAGIVYSLGVPVHHMNSSIVAGHDCGTGVTRCAASCSKHTLYPFVHNPNSHVGWFSGSYQLK